MFFLSNLFRLNLKEENPYIPSLEVFFANKFGLENNKKLYFG